MPLIDRCHQARNACRLPGSALQAVAISACAAAFRFAGAEDAPPIPAQPVPPGSLETITVNDNLGKKANGLGPSPHANLIETA